jgi:hypothetical protein
MLETWHSAYCGATPNDPMGRRHGRRAMTSLGSLNYGTPTAAIDDLLKK